MPTRTAPKLTSPEFHANPYPFYAHLRAEAPVYRTTLPNKQEAWLITRYDDVLSLLKDERFVKDPLNATAPGQKGKTPWIPGPLKPLTRNMLDLDAPDHTRLRALVHKAFTPGLIGRLSERIQTLCDELLDATQAGGRMELIHDYALPLPMTIITELLGVPAQDRAKFHTWSKSLVEVASATDLLRALPHLLMFMRYLRRLCKQRRADPRDDLVTGLVQAEEAGDTLSEDELLAMVFLLLVAGHETTVNLIGNGTLALLQHPEQLDLLRQNPALIKSAVEELARYTSPVSLATERYAREDVTLQGTTIPCGALVYAVLASANHDQEQFARPDTLDLARESNKHLAFGQGMHYCLGAPLARLEAGIAFNTLLRRMPNLRLSVAPEALRWRKGLVIRGLEKLPLTF